jgi:subtilisin family serine protease
MRSRFLPALATLAVIGSLFAASSGSSASASAPQRVKGSFIVQLRRGVKPSAAAEIARRYGGKVSFNYDALGSFAFSGPDGARRRLAADPRVAAADADYVVGTADDPPPAADHLAVTNSDDARGAGYDGDGPVQRALIAVIDTGVDRGHAFFQSHGTVISAGYGGCVGAKTGTDQNGHGTAVAGNAAGRAGVAHDAAVYPIRVFPGSGESTTWAKVICGLNAVRKYNTNHPTEAQDIDVVNLSIAGPGTASLNTAVQALLASGVIVVAAAGNNGGAVQAPAKYAGVISVSALNHYGTGMASFSARPADVAAPGVHIFGPDNNGRTSYRTGTSRSAPQVAGAVAVMLAINPALTNAEVTTLLRESGRCPGGSQRGASPCGSPWPGGTSEPRLDTYCAAAGADIATADVANCPQTP